ncbi:hypothetical protein HMPREF1141_3356 [Clostridium sp. MSTE9]|nr:hypothetical protein HMPREF1141_3356 [Clostridium sp. MSTE9]
MIMGTELSSILQAIYRFKSIHHILLSFCSFVNAVLKFIHDMSTLAKALRQKGEHNSRLCGEGWLK